MLTLFSSETAPLNSTNNETKYVETKLYDFVPTENHEDSVIADLLLVVRIAAERTCIATARECAWICAQLIFWFANRL